MIITSSNDSSERLSAKHVDLLRNQCDDVRTFTECGWFCILGYRGRDRLVYAHCNSREEYEKQIGLLRDSAYGYRDQDEQGYLIQATATYRVDEEIVAQEAIFFCSADPGDVRDEMMALAAEKFREPSGDEKRVIKLQMKYWDEKPRFERVTGVGSNSRRSFSR
jgi:hypothetical protein